MTQVPDKNPLEMSDEAFGELVAPPEVIETPEEKPEGENGAESGAEAAPGTETDAGAEGGDKQEDGGDKVVDAPAGDADKDKQPEGEGEAGKDKPAEGAEGQDKDKAQPKGKEGDDPSGSKAAGPAVNENFSKFTPEHKAGLFDQIMAPFKANGKMIDLRTPEEAIKLMQMGANYTKKLQDLQPHRKVLMMLENNGLLDAGKLSFLIDVDRRDPEAIKKLLKDSGIDPMDLDTATDPAYAAGSHEVTDAEANFKTVLDEIASNPTGNDTLQVINTKWDKASKEALWQSPEIMTVIHEQRENGIYDVIASEVDRQRTLGLIPATTPFLQAYKDVGDAMAKEAIGANGGGEPGQEAPGDKTASSEPLATKVAAPKSTVANGDQASAASPTRATPKTAEVKVNPLAMSDDAFLKDMENRL